MTNRKSFVFPPQALERLERLRIACRLATQSNVIRLALMVLEDLLKALAAGKTIKFVAPDGSVQGYHPLLSGDETA
jgi:hypothetical protein